MTKPTNTLTYEIRTRKTKTQGVFAARNISLGAIFMSGTLLLRADTRLDNGDDRNSEAIASRHICQVSHSSSPNAKCDRNRASRMEVCALRDIRYGEEITLSLRDVVAFRAQPRSLSIPGHTATLGAKRRIWLQCNVGKRKSSGTLKQYVYC